MADKTLTELLNDKCVPDWAIPFAIKAVRRIMPKKMINAGFTSKAYLEGYNDAISEIRRRAK